MLLTARASRALGLFAILSALTACGGGGGGGSPPPPPPPPATTYTVTAAVTGLAGSGLTLLDNGGDSKAVSADGSVTFATALANAATYAVTVGTQPATPSQTCTVTNGSGTIAGANVTNVAVACVTKTFTVGGAVSGLAGSGLQLQNNAGDTLNVTQNGSFTFATGLPLTPTYQAAELDVARGTAGSLRPDRVPGSSLEAGGGSLKRWFNTAAFTEPAGPYGTASRNSIAGPGTIQNSMSLSKTMQLGETRSMEIRASSSNVFNTVQYSGVDTSVNDTRFGQVTGAAGMRSFTYNIRYRF